MRFEHVALNVPQPKKMADWYAQNLNMKIVKSMDVTPFVHFVEDESGQVVFELYNNETAPLHQFPETHHLNIHIAFSSADARKEKEKLMTAGATLVEEIITPDNSILVMLRDPFGMPLQICQRTTPF